MSTFLTTIQQYFVIIFPWLIFGTILSFIVNKKFNSKHFQKFSGPLSFPKLITAQFLGMISPLSILSFLPVASELTAMGTNPSLLLSFFIAERAYDLQSFFIITSLFGLKFAVLNILAILTSLIFSALSIKNDHIKFRVKPTNTKHTFWTRQIKLLTIATFGIFFGALIRTLVPPQIITNYSGDYTNGFLSSLLLGFSIYLGPIASNYPVAKAFSELGMSPVGTFTFLTVGPIANFVILILFSAAVGYKKIIKPIAAYILTACFLSLIFSLFL